jgi:hypothetical protein
VTSTPAFRRFALAFSTGFALIYVIARVRGLALLTVYPSLGVVLPGAHRSHDVADPVLDFLAPEMWWYGWIATAVVGALVIGFIAALFPARWAFPLWPQVVWMAPIVAMIACVYLTVPWFRQ